MTQLAQRIKVIPVASVLPNPEQPRIELNEDEIQELAVSIQEHGVIHPIAVEAATSPNGVEEYILHDGQRRLHATKVAGLETIPAIVSPGLNGTGPYERLMRALVANIHAVPMNPVDDALAFRRLRDEFKLTHREISKRTGKHEAWISTRMRLADLDPEILDLMRAKKLSTESKAVTALHSIRDSQQRIYLARTLAEKRATADMVVEACYEFQKMKTASRKKTDAEKELTRAVNAGNRAALHRRVNSTPALDTADDLQQYKEEWNALFQLGKVPPYPIVNDVVMRTCDGCAMRAIASESICSGCALVSFLTDMMATVKAEAVIHA